MLTFAEIYFLVQHLALTRKMVEISRENEVLKRRVADADSAAAAAGAELESMRYACVARETCVRSANTQPRHPVDDCVSRDTCLFRRRSAMDASQQPHA